MMHLGQHNNLYINRFTPQGAYLVEELDETPSETVNEVLLPNKYLSKDAAVGDQVRVFFNERF